MAAAGMGVKKFSAPEPDPEQQARFQKLLREAMKKVEEAEREKTRTGFREAITSQIIKSSSGSNDWVVWEAPAITSDHTMLKEEMAKASRQAAVAMRKTGTVYQEALERATKIFQTGKMLGHRFTCLYDGTHEYACTCQPPTAWGRVLLWHCDCCGHPLSPMQYGLCDLCHAHQYDPPVKARADHEAAGLQ